MDDLIIERTKDTFFTPEVRFLATGHCTISGESYIEESFQFYDRLIQWVDEYFKTGAQQLEMHFKYTYFNTSSSRAIMDLCVALRQWMDKGKQLQVYWHYPEEDHDDLLTEGEEFSEDARLPMQFCAY